MKPEVRKQLIEAFKKRLQNVYGIDVTNRKALVSAKALKAQAEFIAGAIAALHYANGEPIDAAWTFCAMGGRSIITEHEELMKRLEQCPSQPETTSTTAS